MMPRMQKYKDNNLPSQLIKHLKKQNIQNGDTVKKLDQRLISHIMCYLELVNTRLTLDDTQQKLMDKVVLQAQETMEHNNFLQNILSRN